MGRRRVHPPAPTEHERGSSSGEQHKCDGYGFVEEQCTVVIGREPWECPKFSAFCRRLAFYCAVTIVLLLLLLLQFAGSRPPQTSLAALIVHGFNLTRNASLVVAPWLVNGNLTVVFRASNPSLVAGFPHRYVTMLVTAWYGTVLLGRAAPVPPFSQAQGSARKVSAKVLISEQCVNHTTAEMMRTAISNGRLALQVTVEACVKVKRLRWTPHPKWFNSSSKIVNPA